jgi:ABC-type sugar transport system permease subunit
MSIASAGPVPLPTAAQDRRSHKSAWQRIKASRWSYLFIAPWLILTAVFGWYPMVSSIRYAFYNWRGFGDATQYVGIRHFVTVATSSVFWQSVRHALTYTITLVPIQLTLALVLALILNNPRLRLSSIFRAGFFIPAICSIATLAVPVRYLVLNLNRSVPDLIVNAGLFNPSKGFLQDPRLALGTITTFGIWQSFGYNLVFFLAALQSVPPELYEAAIVDGAGRWAKFRHITIPLIRPVGILILLLAILGSMRVFESVLVLTNGGPFYATEVPATYIYHYAFSPVKGSNQTVNLGFASAASMFYSVLLLGLTAMQVIVVRRNKARRRELGLS